MPALAPALAPELLPFPPAFVPLSGPPQAIAASRPTVDTKNAVRSIGVDLSQQEQGPA